MPSMVATMEGGGTASSTRAASLSALAVAACLAFAGCSSNSLVGGGSLASGSTNFAHKVEKLSSGKSRLLVTVAAGPGQSEDFVSQQASGYAYDFAQTACPKGYDFYADDPLPAKLSATARYQRSYIFQCR